MTAFNLPAATVSLISAAVILWLIRRQRLGVLHTLWWLLAAGGMLVLGLFPAVADVVGRFFGIHYPPVLPIVAALCLVFVKILTMDMERTRQETNIRILAQRMAAYETEVRELKARLSEPQNQKND